MAKKRKSRRDAISTMLSELVVLLPGASRAFCDVVEADPESRRAALDALQAIELVTDQHYEKLLTKVGDTFITPFDREDLYRLLDTVDDVIDGLANTAALIVAFDHPQLSDDFAANTRRLIAMSELTSEAVVLLKKPKKLEGNLRQFYLHEQAMGESYRTMLVAALSPGDDPIRAMQLKVLLDSVEQAASDLDQFARALGAIAIKET